MKAPLRYAFGWVIYLGVFAAINYPMAVIWEAVKVQPLWLSVFSAVFALAVTVWLIATRLFLLWDWCDAPRNKPSSQEVC